MNNILKDLVVRATVAGGMEKQSRLLRRLSLMAVSTLKKPKEKATSILSSYDAIWEQHDREAGSWATPEELLQEGPAPFDACDLRHWLLIAEKAGVPTVPARVVLSLTETEFGLVCGSVEIPEIIRQRVEAGLKKLDFESPERPPATAEKAAQQREILERLYDAMDDVPAGWMVRSSYSGSALLKGMAGTGTIHSGEEFYDFGDGGPKLGPGYVSFGNRRCIDVKDARIIEIFAGGHKPEIHFLARPWITASRMNTADDPHRHGSVFAGKGTWPSEWRVFVEQGRVRGVASYYPWSPEASAEDAYRALEAVEAAERIVAEAKKLQAYPRYMDLEFARKGAGKEILDRRFPRDGIACTLDFIETDDGPMLLEGGPPHSPIGGAHPCAFAGHGVKRGTQPSECKVDGVALRAMPHVHLAEGATMYEGDYSGCIFTWEEARELADQYQPAGGMSP